MLKTTDEVRQCAPLNQERFKLQLEKSINVNGKEAGHGKEQQTKELEETTKAQRFADPGEEGVGEDMKKVKRGYELKNLQVTSVTSRKSEGD